MKKVKNTNKTAIKVGTGLATATAIAAAGYYFYGSKNARSHRKVVEKWVNDIDPADLKRAMNNMKSNWEMVKRGTKSKKKK